MSRRDRKVSPKDRTWLTLEVIRRLEAEALGRALRNRHPLGTSKLVVADVAAFTGFEIKFDTVQSWLADGRTPSIEALAALDATYGAEFIMERRKPFIDLANQHRLDLKRQAVKAAEAALAEAEFDLAQAQKVVD